MPFLHRCPNTARAPVAWTQLLLPGRPATSLPQHQRIISAICARDPEAAETAMRDHIASVIEAMRTTNAIELVP